MIRKIAWGIAGILALSLTAGTAFAGDQLFEGFQVVHITLNGSQVKSDVPAVNFYGRTVVPLRVLTDTLNLDLTWDGSTNTAHLKSKADSGSDARVKALEAELAAAQRERDAAKAELQQARPSSAGIGQLSETDLKAVKGLDVSGFDSYLQTKFGQIGGLQLRFVSVMDGLYGFTTEDEDGYKKLPHDVRLTWVYELMQVMEARFPAKGFNVALSIRKEYYDYPSSYPDSEITLSGGKWVVAHRVLGTHRVDLPTYGLQPTSVVVTD